MNIKWVLAGLLPFAASYAQSQDIIDFNTFGAHRAHVLETTSRNLISVGSLGDINADGLADILLGSRQRGTEPTEVFAEIILGNQILPGRESLENGALGRFRLFCDSCSNLTFEDSAFLGDLDRDGADDCLLGFPSIRFPDKSLGSAFLLYGGASVLRPSLSLNDVGTRIRGCRFISSDISHAALGFAVESIDDFNNDSNVDFVISAPSQASPESLAPGMDIRGQVFVVFGHPQMEGTIDLSLIASQGNGILIEGPGRTLGDGSAVGTPFGIYVSGLGDVNGDEFADFVISDDANSYIVLGQSSPARIIDLKDILLDVTHDHVILVRGPDYERTRLTMGQLTGLGDVNGDGLGEIAIGMSKLFFNPEFTDAGRVYLVYGRHEYPSVIDLNNIPLPEADVVVFGTRTPELFGAMVLSAGDMNGDQLQDLAMPARGTSREGDLHVLYGVRDSVKEIRLREPYFGLVIRGERAEDQFAMQLSSMGDFNGDSLDDLVALARHPFPLGNDYPDRAYIILGEDTSRPVLSIFAVEPSIGVQRGGSEVSIRGKGFTRDTTVWFDGRMIQSQEFKSEFEINGLSPPGSAKGKIGVEVRRGLDVAMLPNGFEYTQNMPTYNVRNLDRKGLVIDGDFGIPGSRAFTFLSGSPLAFEDFNGDSIDDLVVESTASDGWLVTLVRGRPDLYGVLPAYEVSQDVTIIRESESHFGSTGKAGCYVASIGDVNDDGYKDLGIGTWDGIGFVLFGRSGLLDEGEIILEREIAEDRASRIELGMSLEGGQVSFCGLGDMNGNGIDEFAIGDWRNGGQIRLVEVGETWFQVIADLDQWTLATLGNSSPDIVIGQIIRSVGDLNGDSITDLLVGSEVINKRGVVLVVYGKRDFPATFEVSEWVENGEGVRIEIKKGFEYLSFVQASEAGDVNHDGYDDVLIGVEGGGELVTQGVTYVLFGGASLPSHIEVTETGPLPAELVEVMGEGPMEQAGRVGPAGDFNHDGFDDFLIGGPGIQSEDESGNVFVVYGRAVFPPRIELRQLGGMGLKINGQNVPGGAGFAVGPWGDLNGDREPDFVFSEIGNPISAAHVYVIYGPFASKDFIRGDANIDGNLNITDAISVLAFLFSGGEAPFCMDAADSDDDGSLTITDPIRLLNYLFLGLSAPPPPFPGLGQDPTEDKLNCLLF